jgi:hypothetical protein
MKSRVLQEVDLNQLDAVVPQLPTKKPSLVSKATVSDSFSLSITSDHSRFVIDKPAFMACEATLSENYIYTPEFEQVKLAELKGARRPRVKEDLTDEAFVSRHRKDEQFERKVKKWDKEWISHIQYRELMAISKAAQPALPRKSLATRSNAFLNGDAKEIAIKMESPVSTSFDQQTRSSLLAKFYRSELAHCPSIPKTVRQISKAPMPSPKRRRVHSALSNLRKRFPVLPVKNLEECLAHMHIVKS